MGESRPTLQSLRTWLGERAEKCGANLVCVGLQEVEMGTTSVAMDAARQVWSHSGGKQVKHGGRYGTGVVCVGLQEVQLGTCWARCAMLGLLRPCPRCGQRVQQCVEQGVSDFWYHLQLLYAPYSSFDMGHRSHHMFFCCCSLSPTCSSLVTAPHRARATITRSGGRRRCSACLDLTSTPCWD